MKINKKFFINIYLILFVYNNIFCFNVSEIYNQSNKKIEDFFIAKNALFGDLTCLENEFSDFSLGILNKDELWILRNTIFAKYGYKFTSEFLMKYFSQFEWYNPQFENVDEYLSIIDKKNIDKIMLFEKIDRKIFMDVDVFSKFENLVWNKTQIIAAGYDDCFIFSSGKKIQFNFSEMDMKKSFISYSGTYELTQDGIIISFTKITTAFLYVDLSISEDIQVYFYDDCLLDSKEISIQMDKPIILYLPFSFPKTIDFYGNEIEKIKIGTTEYYLN